MSERIILKQLLENIWDGVCITGLDRKVLYWNDAAQNITGYSAKEMVGVEYPSKVLKLSKYNEGVLGRIEGFDLLGKKIEMTKLEEDAFLQNKNGQWVSIDLKIISIVEKNTLSGIASIFRKKASQEISHYFMEDMTQKVMLDQLTKLPNRMCLEQYLSYRMNILRASNKPFCVVYADIDDFRFFNNHYGHQIGDEVLKSFGEIVRENIKKDGIMGRWGGEEFLGIFSLPPQITTRDIGEFVLSLFWRIKIPALQNNMIITASIGVAVANKYESEIGLITRADSLMYKSKVLGKNQVSIEE